jgi:hypothetical protein
MITLHVTLILQVELTPEPAVLNEREMVFAVVETAGAVPETNVVENWKVAPGIAVGVDAVNVVLAFEENKLDVLTVVLPERVGVGAIN